MDRWEKEEEKLRTQAASGAKKTGPSADYTMKEGQTIKINFGKKTASGSGTRPAPSSGMSFFSIPCTLLSCTPVESLLLHLSTVGVWLGLSANQRCEAQLQSTCAFVGDLCCRTIPPAACLCS